MPDLAPFDHSRAAAFEERLVGVLNAGALCLMTSLGHRVGLFDAMADMPAASSEAIAARSGLNERYVREWLGRWSPAGLWITTHETGTYAFPCEHAAFLTRAATPANLAVFAQYMPLLGRVEDDVVACFRLGGGVPYVRFERFHEVMAEDSGQTVLPVLKSHILPLVPGLDERLKDGIRILDVGCGRGRAFRLSNSRAPRPNSGATRT